MVLGRGTGRPGLALGADVPGTGGKQGVWPGRAVGHPRTDEESAVNGETETQTEARRLPHWAVKELRSKARHCPRPDGEEDRAVPPGVRPPVTQVSRSALAPGQPVKLQATVLKVLSDV